jgi:tRNA(Ile)-lysidine synthase
MVKNSDLVSSAPLSWQELSHLLPCPLINRVAVAVSGGPDSMALALVTQKLCHHTGVAFSALTVDHALRSESLAEAKEVHQWFKSQGVDHQILTWHHETIITGLQEKARKARYDLLSQWCLENNVPFLFTGHHALDQWETIMMRLSKGSGLTGLCGIRPMVKMAFGTLVRPLLTINPQRLLETVQHHGAPFWQDPSNKNINFERVRFRHLHKILEKEGLGINAILETRERLQQAEDYLTDLTQKTCHVCIENGHLLLAPFRQQPLEIAHRLLKRWLQDVGGHPYPPSRQSLDRLYEKLLNPNFKGATAAGCVLKRVQGGKVQVKKEHRT